MKIEFLWFDGCPNHREARALLDAVLISHGVDPARAVESIRVTGETVKEHRFPGSPTIRINGQDIEPGFSDQGAYALSCRVPGVPPRRWIEDAVASALGRSR